MRPEKKDAFFEPLDPGIFQIRESCHFFVEPKCARYSVSTAQYVEIGVLQDGVRRRGRLRSECGGENQ
jgi:hypothetical protein